MNIKFNNITYKRIVALFVGMVLFTTCIALTSCKKGSNEVKSNVVNVESAEKLMEKLDVKITKPKDTKSVKYGIESENIARVEYSKEVSDGYTMDFLLKSSSATEDLVEYDNDFSSIKILMTVICNDGSDVEVTSYVAVDDTNIMKSEWYDNDLYYAMTTENLTSRDDFLQEVNRVIIDTHDDFS